MIRKYYLDRLLGMDKKIAIFLPPLQVISGGFAVLVHLGRHLAKANCDVCFVIKDGDIPYASYTDTLAHLDIPVVEWEDIVLGPEYTWIVPEGWVNALVLGLKAKARCIVYMQAWSFGITALPGETRWDQLDLEFLYVSEPVRMCLEAITGKEGHIIRPGIDSKLFYPPELSDLKSPVDKPIRIAWMPRKNKVFSELIQNALNDRLARLYPDMRVQWVKMQHMTLEEVAETLRSCHIFLATGFPEGCPLPPLEAMASGCMVVGFTGLGGWDYMRQADFITDEYMSYLQTPWFNLRETSFEGNGLYVADADVLGATLALEQACVLLTNGGIRLEILRNNLAETAKAYSLEAQAQAIIDYLPHLQK